MSQSEKRYLMWPVYYSGGGIQMNRALGAKFFIFGMVLGIGMIVSKTIANKLWSISGGHLA